MSKLISAGFFRMRKTWLFFILALLLAAVCVAACIDQYHWVLVSDAAVALEKMVFPCAMISSFVIAIFSSLFLGAEYADGTIRNKIVSGHTRTQVYLSGFFLCALAGLLFDAVIWVIVLALGIPMFGLFTSGTGIILMSFLCSVLVTLAFAAFFTALSMTISSRTINAVLCLVLAVVCALACVIFQAWLEEPEMRTGMYELTMGGQVVEAPPEPNPHYLQPRQRAAVELALDALPSGQALQLASFSLTRPTRMVILSLAEIVLFNLFGLAVFRKKDLK